MTTKTEILSVQQLTLGFKSNTIVHAASLSLQAGQTTALIGESGSGKTLLAKSLIDLLPPGCTIKSGDIRWQGTPIPTDCSGPRARLRGKHIAFIFQEPLSSLNPALKIGIQLTEALAQHTSLTIDEQRAAAITMLCRVKITDPGKAMQAYPHQLSGGMRQRVMIAAALLLQPALLIADEPTTALDMIVRDEILGLMTELATETGTAVLIISHDLGSVARLADQIIVMEKGRIVEQGGKDMLLSAPKHAYTQKLLAAIPQPIPPSGTECDRDIPIKPPLISVRNLKVAFQSRAWLSRNTQSHTAVKDLSFDISPGETLAIIGESGSGKTTVARTIAGLQEKTAGTITCPTGAASISAYAKTGKLQYIFQDPAGALNPRHRVGTSVCESLLPLPLSSAERAARCIDVLKQVQLPADIMERFPHQLSGGQRQRVCIARAIAPKPDLIIADEPVSALDLTVQKQVLDLFLALKEELSFACLFISHDLGVVEHIADRVGVLLKGNFVEIGTTNQIFNSPKHSYTQQLLAATPCLEKTAHGFTLNRRFQTQPAQ